MDLIESREDYLERILILEEEKGIVRSIDIAQSMNFSKASVSIAMKKLKDNGLILVDEKGHISLTDKGKEIAESTYSRHKVLSKLFIYFGVNKETAKKDACKVEHDISEDTFKAIQNFIQDK